MNKENIYKFLSVLVSVMLAVVFILIYKPDFFSSSDELISNILKVFFTYK